MSVYYLYEYNIALSTIEKIDSMGIDLNDIKILGEQALISLFKVGSLKMKQTIHATNLFFDKEDKENIYILLKFGLSKGICETLFSMNITPKDLIDMTELGIQEKYQLSRTVANRTMLSFEEYIKNDKENTSNKDYSIKLDLILKKYFSIKECYSFITLKDLLVESDYPVKYFDEDLERLRKKGIVKYTMEGIVYVFPKLKEYINKSVKENRKSILYDRFHGLTLEEIGNKQGVTRERIRQIIAKQMSKIPTLYEDKYKTVFEYYYWECEDFVKFYNEEEITYFYLNERYKKGEHEIHELLTQEITEHQREYISQKYKIERVLGEKIVVSRNEVLKLITKYYAKDNIVAKDLSNLFNDYVNNYLKDYQLQNFDDRTIEGCIDRLKIAVFGHGRMIRYFDYNELTENDIKMLGEMFNLDDGFYSTKIMFDSNIHLMNSIDIRNEYELHNLLKKLFSDNDSNIKFLRMPNFIVGEMDKDEFIVNKIEELSPISVSDFVHFLEVEYGHKSNTMSSYILSSFGNYINNGYLEVDNKKLYDPEILKLTEIYTDDIYTIANAKKILKDHGYSNEYFNNYNMLMIGYKIRSNYIMKKSYLSVDELLMKLSQNEDFIKIDKDYFKVSSFYFALIRFEQKFDIVKIDNDEYITYQKLHSLGITKEILYKVRSEIENRLKEKNYISVKHIKNIVDETILGDFGFDDIFYESLISPLDNVKALRINNNKIFTIGAENNRLSFIRYIVNNNGSIEIDKLERLLKTDYDIDVPYYKIKEYIYGSDLYYNEILEKIYIDKKDFYEEVY